MTDADDTQDLSTEADPRVSTEDDGFSLMDDADSVEVQAELDADPDGYDEDAVSEEEH